MNPTNEGEPGQLERLRPLPLPPGDGLASHTFDLGAHEQRRLAAVLAATRDLDPGAVLAAEAAAHRMLYSGLDAEQQATYRMLVDAGVLDA
ncbi:MAG: hypothetical protein V7646_6395 [Pseudonocardia sp.]|jgi:hypothetical protein